MERDDFKANIDRLADLLSTARHDESYDYVKVLFLYWDVDPKNSTSQDFESEAKTLGKLFKTDFCFDVVYYRIPLLSPTLGLQDRVIKLLREGESYGKKALLIIHYGGHGADQSTDGGAVWAPDWSSHKDQQVVKWHEIQSTLSHTSNDVLLLLDCCFASLAGRAVEPGPRIEMICATAKREKTPPPGDSSWTTALTQFLRTSVTNRMCTSAETLARQLLSKQAGLPGTSNHIVFNSGYPSRSIKLRPLNTSKLGLAQTNSDGLCITLSLNVPDLTADRVEEICNWIRTDIPKDVSLKVDSVVQKISTLKPLAGSMYAAKQCLWKAPTLESIPQIDEEWDDFILLDRHSESSFDSSLDSFDTLMRICKI